MVWVRSEYAGELAVLSAWLAAFLPWNVTYSSGIGGGDVLFVRFPLVQFRYTYGIPLTRAVTVTDPISAIALQAGQTIQVAYQVWAVGALLVAAALALSVAYYFREESVESASVDPVRAMGALLGSAGLVLAVATYLLYTRGFPGLPVPLGVVFLLVFGAVLLRVERT